MGKRNRDLQRTIGIVILCILFGLVAWNVSAGLQRRQMSKIYYERIAGVMTLLAEQYPEVEESEWIRVLNTDGGQETGEGEELLRKYGILSGDMPVAEAQSLQIRTQVIGNLIWLLAGAGILCSILLYQKRRDAKIKELTDYIWQIERGIYQIPFEENEEEELSSLKNELYKITVMLREAAERSGKQKRALADSVSDISHQLKTPLTSCLVLLDNMAESEHMSEETRARFITEITGQLTNVSWLIQVLLKLSRLDAGVVELKEEEIRLEELLKQAVERIQLLAEWKQITLRMQGDLQAKLSGDSYWLCEALVNLIKNAIEHSPEQEEILLCVEENQVYIGLSIQDHGCGITPEDQKHIFERFYRSATAKEDSVGIGLALAKEIIQRENGTITVESELGEGTTFRIKFLKCH